MSFFSSINISASGLTAQRLRMDVISQNMANINTTKAANGKPYKRKTVIFEEEKNTNSFSKYLCNAIDRNKTNKSGVKVSAIVEDMCPGNKIYDPKHPHSDKDGYLETPNVNIVEEMVNMISANRSYEANITALNTTKSMITKTLEINR